MRHIQSDESADPMRLYRDWSDVEELTSVVLHQGQPDDGDLRGSEKHSLNELLLIEDNMAGGGRTHCVSVVVENLKDVLFS
jgi:hypothetical protein